MMKHNYGVNDYEKYSKDPEWKKLHKSVFPNYHQISETEFNSNEKITWIMSVVPNAEEKVAKRIVQSLEDYSCMAYKEIHEDKGAKLQQTRDILTVFDSVKTYPYKGTIYRGLYFDSWEDLVNVLSRGRGKWKEPSITSFSTDISIAENFASRSQWGLVLICKNNKSGIPFKHISKMAYEDEILSPGAHRNKDWNLNVDSLHMDKEKKIVYVEIEEN